MSAPKVAPRETAGRAWNDASRAAWSSRDFDANQNAAFAEAGVVEHFDVLEHMRPDAATVAAMHHWIEAHPQPVREPARDALSEARAEIARLTALLEEARQ